MQSATKCTFPLGVKSVSSSQGAAGGRSPSAVCAAIELQAPFHPLAPSSPQVYMAPAPYAPHTGYGSAVLDRLVDWVDLVREAAAIAWYKYKGYI